MKESLGAVDIEELERLLEKATPLPWTNEHMEEGHLAILAEDGETLVALVDHVDDEQRETATACLIPRAINALPLLLAEVRRGREALEKIAGIGCKDGTRTTSTYEASIARAALEGKDNVS